MTRFMLGLLLAAVELLCGGCGADVTAPTAAAVVVHAVGSAEYPAHAAPAVEAAGQSRAASLPPLAKEARPTSATHAATGRPTPRGVLSSGSTPSQRSAGARPQQGDLFEADAWHTAALADGGGGGARAALLEAHADVLRALRRYPAAAGARRLALEARLREGRGALGVAALVAAYAEEAEDLRSAGEFDAALAAARRARDAVERGIAAASGGSSGDGSSGAAGGAVSAPRSPPPASVFAARAAARAAVLRIESAVLDCAGSPAAALAAADAAAVLVTGTRPPRTGASPLAGRDSRELLALTDLLRRARDAPGAPDASVAGARLEGVVAELLARGPWIRADQLPAEMVPGLYAAPWHDIARYPALGGVREALVAATDALAAEYATLRDGGRLVREAECIHEEGPGDWRVFAVNAPWVRRDVATGCAAEAPAACALLASLPASLRVMRAGYSSLSGAARLRPHCGVSNAQLKMHLGLITPVTAASGAPCARLRVGNESRPWTRGGVFMFDDSFLHDVAKVAERGCEGERVVFQLVFAHPEYAGVPIVGGAH